MSPTPGAGKRVQAMQIAIGFGFTSDWFIKWRETFFSQSQSVAMQNQSNREVTFDTRMKATLITFFPTNSTSRPAAVVSAVVRVAVITEHTVRPVIIHTMQNKRPITDLGALSPYLEVYANTSKNKR